MSRQRKRWIFLLKLGIAGVLLLWVVRQTHWHDVVVAGDHTYTVSAAEPSTEHPERLLVAHGAFWWRREEWRPAGEFEVPVWGVGVIRPGVATSLGNLDLSLFALANGAFFVGTLTLALRWKTILTAQGIPLPMREVVGLTFLGDLANSVLPGGSGGDLVKAYYGVKQSVDKAGVIATLLIDRALGFTGLVFQAATMLVVVAWSRHAASAPAFRTAAVGVVLSLAGIAVGMAVLLVPGVRRALERLARSRRVPLVRYIPMLLAAVVRYVRQPRLLSLSVILTLLSQGLWISSVALAGLSLGLTIPLPEYFLYVPMIMIIGAVPLTPGGSGVVEQLFLLFFAGQAAPSAILVLALLTRLITVVCSLPGLLHVISGPRIPLVEVMEAELAKDVGVP